MKPFPMILLMLLDVNKATASTHKTSNSSSSTSRSSSSSFSEPSLSIPKSTVTTPSKTPVNTPSGVKLGPVVPLSEKTLKTDVVKNAARAQGGQKPKGNTVKTPASSKPAVKEPQGLFSQDLGRSWGSL